MPDYLYHYTNLSTLKLILKNRTIRLNSLKNMDDAEEIVTANSEFLGKYCFVSCWTDLEEESIPFWGIYTHEMAGVRLKMQKNPFIKYSYAISYYSRGEIIETYCPEKLWKSNSLYYYPTLPFLRKVAYTENEQLIFPDVISHLRKGENGKYDLAGDFNDINLYKRKCWEFQSEWRYGLLFFPHDEQGFLKMDLTANAEDMPFWYCDLSIREDAFNDIEIMTGPKMSEKDKELLKGIVAQYCPEAKIVNSVLKIN